MYTTTPDRARLVANAATRARESAEGPVLEEFGGLEELETARWEIRESDLGACRVATPGVAAEKRARFAMVRAATIVTARCRASKPSVDRRRGGLTEFLERKREEEEEEEVRWARKRRRRCDVRDSCNCRPADHPGSCGDPACKRRYEYLSRRLFLIWISASGGGTYPKCFSSLNFVVGSVTCPANAVVLAFPRTACHLFSPFSILPSA